MYRQSAFPCTTNLRISAFARILCAAPPETGGKGSEGFIVVAALWILGALAALGVIYSGYLGQSAVALRVNDDALAREALVTSSLELVAYQLSSPAADQRPTRGAFRFQLGGADVAVEFVSEAARIDLNAAPKSLIAGLFAAVGGESQAAVQYADRVIGWRTSPKPNAPNDEDSLYRTAGLAYSPRQAPFNDVDELWLVQGLPPALVERCLPFVTIYSRIAQINVLDAAPEVIAALPGMTPDRLNAFLGTRETMTVNPQFVADALGVDQKGITLKGSDAVRVRIRMVAADGRLMTAEVVIMRGSTEEPYRVLSWKSDGVTTSAMAGGG
jgi:general secretion pathway protein K